MAADEEDFVVVSSADAPQVDGDSIEASDSNRCSAAGTDSTDGASHSAHLVNSLMNVVVSKLARQFMQSEPVKVKPIFLLTQHLTLNFVLPLISISWSHVNSKINMSVQF